MPGDEEAHLTQLVKPLRASHYRPPFMLPVKRFLFRHAPAVAVEGAKLGSHSRRLELAAVRALVPVGTLAVDVGASWGLYTFVLSRLAGTVVAFEPHAEKAQYLTSVFRGRNVTVHQVALSDRSDTMRLTAPVDAPAFATIETGNPLSNLQEETATRVPVEVRPLRDFSLANVGFMKVDAQGHELSVLSGALPILTSDKPIIDIRIERRHNPRSFERTFELLRELGYRGFFWDEWKLFDLSEFDVDRDQPQNNAVGNKLKGRYIYTFVFIFPQSVGPALHSLRGAGFDTSSVQART